ncbi:hypothetical protein ACEWY4_004287 [Coilia grayii]|uniref:Uncharacterized protein n=1 Tax=Coilia grayii TaxID=363190 RepID=A0ABD1KLA8_9TELE
MDHSDSSKPNPGQQRETWSRPSQFVLASIGYAVGMRNLSVFPYIFYQNGGVAYLIPHFIAMFLLALPMLYLEFSIGQLTQRGPVQAFTKLCPLLKGVGVGTVVVSFLLMSYSNTLMSWILFYLFSSFSPTLPWQSCNNAWNIPETCSVAYTVNDTGKQSASSLPFLSSDSGDTTWDPVGNWTAEFGFVNGSLTPSASQQFFKTRLLQITEGIDEMGSVCWELLGCLVFALIIEYICIFKGVKLTGKVVYVTTLLPYAILFLLLVLTLRLEGAADGLYHFFTPVWHKLTHAHVWVSAFTQSVYTVGVGMGVMVSMASYNNQNYNNICRDSFIVTMATCATSLFCGVVVFSALGHLAHKSNVDIADVALPGPGLVFVVYPEILAAMPVPQLWAVLFFLMLFCLELGRQFSHLELVGSCVVESLGPKLPPGWRSKDSLLMPVCVASFLVGLPCVFQGGLYVFLLMDQYTTSSPVPILVVLEIAAICWILGLWRFSDMLSKTLGKTPNIYFRVCWLVITPLMVLVVLVVGLAWHFPLYYETYKFPYWTRGVGLLLIAVSIVHVPIGLAHELMSTQRPLQESLPPPAGDRVEMEEV